MHRKYPALAAGAFLALGLLFQVGCQPQPSVSDSATTLEAPPTEISPTEISPTDAFPTDPSPTDVSPTDLPAVAPPPPVDRWPTEVPTVDASPSAAPATAAPDTSSAADAQPTRAAANQTPTAEPAPDVVAVSIAKQNNVAEVDPLTGRMIRVVDMSEPAGDLALAPDGQTAWVFKPQAQGSTIAVLDLPSGKKHDDVHFHESDRPVAVAFSADASRAYIATAGSIVFTANGKEYGRVAVGHQTAGVTLPRRVTSLTLGSRPSGDVLYAADQASGVVWVLDADSGAQLAPISVGGGPIQLVPDPARQRIYALLDTVNEVAVIDTARSTVARRVKLPATPVAAAVGPDGTLFVSGGDTAGELWQIKPSATDISARVPIGGRPVGLTFSRDGKALYVADATAKTLDVITADTIQVIRTVKLPAEPVSVLANSPTPTPTPSAAVTPQPKATPAATPTLVPSPTPLPDGALVPDNLPPGAIAEPFVPGALQPSALAFTPDGRLLYAEQHTGKIRVVQNGEVLAAPFFQLLVSDQAESGLLGLTLDPNFPTNHYVYAFYTAPKTGSGATGPSGVVRITDVNNTGTDLHRVLSNLPPLSGQNSGAFGFGPDGKLYVGIPDDDTNSSGQDLGSLAGKILRVNPDGSAPTDNPFVGQSGKLDVVWAFGVHHPTSLAFHPIGQQLLGVDSLAGQKRDALQLIARGVSLGDPLAVIKPSIAPGGSTFYLGDQFPVWKNDWFYCDAGQKELRRVQLAAESFDRVVSEEVVKLGCTNDVATGPDGALYYSDAQGIYRIRMPDADVLPSTRGV